MDQTLKGGILEYKIMKQLVNGATTTTTWYMRDASGNVMSTYSENAGALQLDETYIYGSSRIGSYNANLVLGQSTGGNDPIQMVEYFRGQIVYELSNHLGNVLAVITDRKIGSRLSGPGNWEHFEVDYTSFSDYYPFGMLMPGRTYSSEGYSWGFNGKEKDDEVSDQGNCYDYGFRIYNSRLGKFLSVDPLSKSYPWYTPYQFTGNKPIWAIDLDGLEDYVVTISELDKGIVMIKVDFIYTEKANNEKTNKPVIEKVKDEATPSLGTGGIEYRYSDGTKVRKSNFDPGSPEAVIMSLEKSYRDINGNVKVGTRKDYLGNKDVESEYIQSAEVLFVTTIAEYDNNSSKMKTELDLLDEVADRIKNKRGNVLLVGHTDKDPVLKNISPDDPDGNKKLSLQRAENVRSALVKKGADLAKIKIFGAGSLKADRTKKNPSDRKVIAIDYKE